MRIVTVDEHRYTHTCPADIEPHVIDTVRSIVDRTQPQPCLTPYQVADGTGATIPVDCHHYEPHERRCGNCRQIVVTRTVTTTHLGHDTPGRHPLAPAGLAPDPCICCGEPLAAVLADHGGHLGCIPPRRKSRRISRPVAAA